MRGVARVHLLYGFFLSRFRWLQVTLLARSADSEAPTFPANSLLSSKKEKDGSGRHCSFVVTPGETENTRQQT